MTESNDKVEVPEIRQAAKEQESQLGIQDILRIVRDARKGEKRRYDLATPGEVVYHRE